MAAKDITSIRDIQPDGFYSFLAAERALKISRVTLRKWFHAGRIETDAFGRIPGHEVLRLAGPTNAAAAVGEAMARRPSKEKRRKELAAIAKRVPVTT